MEDTNLAGKNIILGVTGSIAAYKAATVASRLTQARANVDVIMTEAATRFVAPLTFQALTGRPVYTSMWGTEDTSGGLPTHIAHVGLAHSTDLLLIAPCTANTIAKLALGLADDLLSVTVLAVNAPVVIAPAMDAGMYENAATQGHVATLEARGVLVAHPAVGRMASGFEGRGRLIEPDEIVGWSRVALGKDGPLAGRRVVVTAGPTQETIDPVRYITNRSSGRQGYALAQAAIDAGAAVTLITGPVGLPMPVGAEVIDVTSTLDMHDAVLEYAPSADVLIMAAAVADFRPATISADKIKKTGGVPSLELAANPDILLALSEQADRPTVTVGFAAESRDLIENARGKLARKKLDLIVANDITASDAGFAAPTNRVAFVTADGVEELPLLTKEAVAARIVDWIAARF